MNSINCALCMCFWRLLDSVTHWISSLNWSQCLLNPNCLIRLCHVYFEQTMLFMHKTPRRLKEMCVGLWFIWKLCEILQIYRKVVVWTIADNNQDRDEFRGLPTKIMRVEQLCEDWPHQDRPNPTCLLCIKRRVVEILMVQGQVDESGPATL